MEVKEVISTQAEANDFAGPAYVIHWLQHCGSWFGFTEPARYAPGIDGGNFVSVATGEPLHSIAQNGMHSPTRGLTPWAAQQLANSNLA